MRYTSWLLLLFLFVFGDACAQTELAQLPTTSTASSPQVINIPSPTTIHGIGFSRMSNFNPQRSYNEARKSAYTDLEASLLTSVMLEYYGTDGRPTRLLSEFAISDSIDVNRVVHSDSAHVGNWAVYYLTDKHQTYQFPQEMVDKALATSWSDELFSPVKINGFWIAAGKSNATKYNPNRGWTKAKQQALSNLSEYLNTNVASLQRLKDENLETVHYVTSKHIFNNIGVIGRRTFKDTYLVLIIVEELNVIQLEH